MVFLETGSFPISIHAPVKGATLSKIKEGLYGSNFNPRPREGSDEAKRVIRGLTYNFNPRPREGSDFI